MAGSSIISKTTDMVISGREVEEQRVNYVCVLALVDVTAPRSLAIPVRDAFDPRLPTSEVRVVAADSFTDLLAPSIPDVCVAVMGRDSANVAAGVTELAAAGVPVALVVESALDAPRLHLGETDIHEAKTHFLGEGLDDGGFAHTGRTPHHHRGKGRRKILVCLNTFKRRTKDVLQLVRVNHIMRIYCHI